MPSSRVQRRVLGRIRSNAGDSYKESGDPSETPCMSAGPSAFCDAGGLAWCIMGSGEWRGLRVGETSRSEPELMCLSSTPCCLTLLPLTCNHLDSLVGRDRVRKEDKVKNRVKLYTRTRGFCPRFLSCQAYLASRNRFEQFVPPGSL